MLKFINDEILIDFGETTFYPAPDLGVLRRMIGMKKLATFYTYRLDINRFHRNK